MNQRAVTPGWLRSAFLFAILAGLTCRVHAQPGFTAMSTVRFDVKYQRGIAEEDAKRVADYLQSDYEYLSAKLDLDLDGRLEVRIYDAQGKYLDATGQKKPWRLALFHRGILHVQPVAVLFNEHSFEKSLSYELALAILDQAGGKGCPNWLREAYAVYHSGMMSDLTPPVGARVNSFGDLDEELQQNQQPPRRLDVLYLLGQTMKYFMEQHGEEKALGVFKAFTGKESTEKVFAKQFGVEMSDTEKAWAEYIRSHSQPFKSHR